MKIFVFGHSGQVAHAIRQLVATEPGNGFEWSFFSRQQVDFENPAKLAEVITSGRPGLVVNTSAYTAVDLAETESQRALAVNAQAVQRLGQAAAQVQAPVIHFSTDYVYSGQGDKPHLETDRVAPINTYGKSKALGDQYLLESGAKALILRTSWVYAPFGANFVQTMLRLGSSHEELSIVTDQIGAPTSALDLARVVVSLAQRAVAGPEKIDWGIYHVAGRGATSWFGFAEEVFRQARALGFPLQVKRLNAIPTSAYITPAQRPLNSRLNQDKLYSAFGLRLPVWQESLAECLELLK